MFHSPYHFVPLVDPQDPMRQKKQQIVVRPQWGEQVTHDIPFSDGLSGWLDLKIHTHSPLFIGGNQGKERRHYRTPAGDFGIPGTSLRGALRNVLEIASFSRMRFVTSRRYSVRDLHNRALYGVHMTETIGGAYAAKARAGWLTQSPQGQWQLHPCPHWRVECTTLESFFHRSFQGSQLHVSRRFEELGEEAKRPLWFDGDERPKNYPHGGGKTLRYRKARALYSEEADGRRKAWVVLTGRPGPSKHMDFLFAEPHLQDPIVVTAPQMEDFRFIHSKDNEQQRDTLLPNDARKYWEDRQAQDDELPGIPVFYLQESNGELRSFGLAQMFKLAYTHTPADLNRAYHDEVDFCQKKPDFGELLFGRVPMTSEDFDPLRGRVSIETAIAREATEAAPVTTILGSPKPSYYPAYIRQSPKADGTVSCYNTYMDDAQLAGWKRYPQRKEPATPPSPAPGQEKVSVTFTPLEAGAAFETRIFVHNLRPQELGALLWVLDFGERSECRHFLGMGRAFGFGSASFQIDDFELEGVCDGQKLTEEELQDTREAFVEYMEEWFLGQWQSSEQIQDLLALATPRGEHPENELRHMKIGPPNEFAKAKKGNLCLPGPRDFADVQEQKKIRYAAMEPVLEQRVAEQRQRQEAEEAERLKRLEVHRREEEQRERQRLMELSPLERQAERLAGLTEHQLWDGLLAVFQRGEDQALLAPELEGQLGESIDLQVEREALVEALGEDPRFQAWQEGQSGENVAGASRLREVHSLVLGVELVDYTQDIEAVGADIARLESLVERASQENWPEPDLRELLNAAQRTSKGGRRWKRGKSQRWQQCIKTLKQWIRETSGA